MTPELLSWATRRALARVLDLEAAALRDDSPLSDLGADSVALIAFADAVEELLTAESGISTWIDDVPLRDAVVLGDLVAAVEAGLR